MWGKRGGTEVEKRREEGFERGGILSKELRENERE